MVAVVKCSSCGSDIEQDVPFRECPKCLLHLGLMPESAPPLEGSQDAGQGTGDNDFLSFGFEEYHKPALPDFEILERIGRGGMGIVYRARQLSLDRIVAIKVIGAAGLASPAAWARFRREAETAAKLDHPNIVPIYEIAEHDGTPFLVMRYVEGASLADKITEFANVRGSRGEIRIAQLVALLARAVHYAHERGVLHRDLKPSNILLDREGIPHLTDFGVAKLMDQQFALTQTAELLGTPFYMSPEQASGKGNSAATDIYSLGVILYELLVGHPPFQAESSVQVLRKAMQEEPVPPHSADGSIDRDLTTICLKCLAKEPSRRYGSALALAEDLERWLRREPILARPAGAILRLRRWTARNPALATLIAGLMAGMVLTLGLLAKAHDEKARKSVALAILRTETARQLQEIWASSGEFFAIKSETLAALAGKEPAQLKTGEQRFTISFVAESNPLDRILSAAPLLGSLEDQIARDSGLSSRLDLRLYKTQSRAVADLIRGDADFMVMNARDYVRAKALAPGIEPLAVARPSLGPADLPQASAVLFTREATGIRSIADLRGRSFLFNTADSTLTFWAKVCLSEAGIHANDLATYCYVDRPNDLPNNPRLGRCEAPGLGNPYSDMTPVEAVVDGTFDAAVANERRFLQVAAREKLVLLARFQDTGSVLVRRSGLPADAAAEFQRAITALSETQILQLFPGNSGAFAPCDDRDFARLRSKLSAESRFDDNSFANETSATNQQIR